jgi:hypothetical protein
LATNGYYAGKEGIGTGDQGAAALLDECCEGIIEVVCFPGTHHENFYPEATCRRELVAREAVTAQEHRG